MGISFGAGSGAGTYGLHGLARDWLHRQPSQQHQLLHTLLDFAGGAWIMRGRACVDGMGLAEEDLIPPGHGPARQTAALRIRSECSP